MRAHMIWEALLQRWGLHQWLLWAAHLLSWRWLHRRRHHHHHHHHHGAAPPSPSHAAAAAAASEKSKASKTKLQAQKKARLPPGPPAWPIVGNLLDVGPIPHVGMRRLNAALGPLVYLRLGSVDAVVTDHPSVVREILKKQDHIFASRPANIASEIFTYGGRDIAFAPYGAHWRSMRRLCLMELLAPRRVQEFSAGRRHELGCIVGEIAERGAGRAVNLRDTFGGLSSNTLTRMLLGKRFFGPGGAGAEEAARHKAMIYEAFALLNSFNVGDYVPLLRWWDVQGREREMRRIMERVDELYDGVIHEYREGCAAAAADQSGFLQQLLSLRGPDGEPLLDQRTLKAIMIDLVAAGTDTSSITSEWTMAELMKHPDIMAKVREEMERVVGVERVVEEKDLPSLHYLKAVVKEIFRLHPVGAFLIPHVSLEDTHVWGYFIPKGTRALINTYSLGRNPKVWDRPDDFVPGRFYAESGVELTDPEFRIVPFGAGRRGCPGATLGTSMVLLGLATLIQCFDWTPLDPSGPLKEAYGLMVLENPLQAYAAPRLAPHFYH